MTSVRRRATRTANAVLKIMEDREQAQTVFADQLRDQIPDALLPPTGNTGSGYTPAPHTHPLSELEQSGANDGQVPVWSGSSWVPGSVAGAGTVTSVGLALPSGLFAVSGSPVTGAGTLTGTLQTQVANRVFAGPAAGAPAAPTFRALAVDDIPGVPLSKLTQSGAVDGQVPVWSGSSWVPGTGGGGGGGGATILLASGELASAAADIDMTSISGAYRHLRLIAALRTTESAVSSAIRIRVNGDTAAANYRGQRVGHQAGGPFVAQNVGAVATVADMLVAGGTAPTDHFAAVELLFVDYATAKLKTARGTSDYLQALTSANYIQISYMGVWNSTAALTRITIAPATGNLASGCSWRLYGLT